MQVGLGFNYENEYRTYRDKGLLALAQKRVNDAIEALGLAALFRPTDPEAHFELGGALELGGKTEAARQAYLRALALNPDLSEARSALFSLPSPPPGREEFCVGQTIRAQSESRIFRVLEIRNGGFGTVYVVDDEKDQTRWALKTFQARFLWSDADRMRFEREALTWLMLDRHPNIVTARGLLHVEGLPCLWLHYVPHSLAEALSRGRLPVELALAYALQFCDGMLYAYQKAGIVHRDIKPSNCLLSEDLRVLQVSDFGLARNFSDIQGRTLGLSEFDPRVTLQFTTAAGTPQYMSPEQFQPGMVLDTRTDIYSFGVMFYEMLTKDLPAVGLLAHSHITQCAPLYGVPEPLEQIILRCVSLDPGERPLDFGELRDLLAIAFKSLTGARPWWEPNPKFLEMDYGGWNDKGIGLENLGYLHEACGCYQRALALEAGDATLWMNYGACLSKLGRFDEALSCYDRGLQIDSEHPALWSNKGTVLDSLGRVNEARTCYERAIGLDSRNDTVWNNLGANTADAGDFAYALICYDHSLGINPRNHLTWSGKEKVLYKLGHYGGALTSCDEGLAIQPRHSTLWNTRACALLELGRIEDALLASDRGLEIEEDSAYLWQTKAAILDRLGAPAEADLCFERAQALRKDRSISR